MARVSLFYPTGNTLYTIVVSADGEYWNDVLTAYEDFNAANITSYAIAMLEDAGVGFYHCNFPLDVPNGTITAGIKNQAGGTPAVSDAAVGGGTYAWDGSLLTDPVSKSGYSLDPLTSAQSLGMVTVEDQTWYFYGSQARAEVYFSKRLDTRVWDEAIANDREAALIMATVAIDKLNFASDKNDVDQNLQFPRGDDIVIPTEIEYATYEVALALLDGYNPDEEVETLGILSESYSGVRTTYDANHVNEHIRAGIPSIEAWEYLRPFLRDPTQVKLSRVS
jgi:hypothetical protein